MMRCALLDDEPMALELLEDYVAKVPFLELAGSFRNALTALEALQRTPVDLLFLDINMPDLTGLQFLKALPDPPLVVFTTAYAEFAVDSYAFEAVDYLLKPIEFDRFLQATQRARAWHSEAQPKPSSQPEVIFIKSGSSHHRVVVKDLKFVEGAGNYVVFATPEKNILALMTMAQVMSLLGGKGFIRVHRSFAVALRHVERFDPDAVWIAGREIPIGETYRSALKALLAGESPSES